MKAQRWSWGTVTYSDFFSKGKRDILRGCSGFIIKSQENFEVTPKVIYKRPVLDFPKL
jgi:hypothetical protein